MSKEVKVHQNEIWQTYYPNGEPILGVGWDAKLDNPEKSGSDVIVGVAIVFLYRFNGNGELELLWQKRSQKVSRYPSDFDISAGGHINLGESLVEAAIRETREEIGVRIEADAPIEDLQLATKEEHNRCEKELENRIKNKIKEGLPKSENRQKEIIYTGKILHLDGDSCLDNKNSLLA